MKELLEYFISNYAYCIELTLEHISIVGISLFVSVLTGVPLGIMITKYEKLASKVLNVANLFMTIPSIALFGMMVFIFAPVGLGIGKFPAIIALILYGQLPIIRNTYAAILNLDPSVIEAGRGIGMSSWRLLVEVEIPLALPIVIAGVRTAAVMSIGLAAIATYIGAGGLGVMIERGILALYSTQILAGALLVSFLAIFAEAGMMALEYYLTPRGIRIGRRSAT